MFGYTKNPSTRTATRTAPGATRSSQSTKTHQLIHHLLRLLQFLSATASLILFSLRLAKILRLVHKASRSNGAVEGILAAAVLYTLTTMALNFTLRASGGGGNFLRILLIIFDLLFVAAFIIVAVLTSPKRHGSSGPCTSNTYGNSFINRHVPSDVNCRLPWGTFILAIFSTLLHAITAAFHVAKDHRRTKHNDHVVEEKPYHGGHDGFVDGNAPGYVGSRETRV